MDASSSSPPATCDRSYSASNTADLDRLDQLQACPTQFQEYVAGIDVRVHVVGERIFATEIDTTATDYRYAGRVGAEMRMRDTRLPDEIATACRRLADTLQLVLTGIDLRRTPDGRWYCFEANPSPVFTYYERYSGQPLTDAVCELLHTAGDRPMHGAASGFPSAPRRPRSFTRNLPRLRLHAGRDPRTRRYHNHQRTSAMGRPVKNDVAHCHSAGEIQSKCPASSGRR